MRGIITGRFAFARERERERERERGREREREREISRGLTSMTRVNKRRRGGERTARGTRAISWTCVGSKPARRTNYNNKRLPTRMRAFSRTTAF